MRKLIAAGLAALAVMSAGCYNGIPGTVDGKLSNAKIEHLRDDRPDDPHWVHCLEKADVDGNGMINSYHKRRGTSAERDILTRCYTPVPIFGIERRLGVLEGKQ